MKYGVVGRNVNLTARIESYTVGGQILISETTMEECGPILRIDDQMEVMPKGVKKPITIYEVGGIGADFNLFLPEKREAELLHLIKPLTVELTILSGKHAGEDSYEGKVIKMVTRAAEIQADVEAHKLDNLKISIFDDHGKEITSDLYAKVTEELPESPNTFRVHFTSVPPQAEAFMEKILASNTKE